MADANQARFSARLSEIEQRHQRATSGFVRMVERDGVLVPETRSRRRRSLPVRGIVLALAAFLLFKAFMLAYLGPATFDNRVSKLAEGNLVEQMGAWAMRADPLTIWVSEQFAGLI